MDIEDQFHTAPEIATIPAQTERKDEYEDRIEYYKSKNYTYIPIPDSFEYYNTDEGWLKPINKEQIVTEDAHLMDILRLLQEQPFVLIYYGHILIENQPFFDIDSLLDALNAVNDDVSEEDIPWTEDDFPLIIVSEFSVFTETRLRNAIPDDSDLGADDFERVYYYDLYGRHPEFVEEYLIFNEDTFGIITPADVNKRGMKQMLYKLISELASRLSTKIEDRYERSEDVFKHLRPVTIGRWQKDQMEGLGMHIAEHMNLIEMMQVIQSSDSSFVSKCGFGSKSDVEKLNKINEIRNRVMHANRSLIYDRRDIQDIIEVVEMTEGILSEME